MASGEASGLNSGEVWAGEKEWSASGASLGARERGGKLVVAPGRPDTGAHRGWP
jgi:hypothetical protein